jgi:hypothetical protein
MPDPEAQAIGDRPVAGKSFPCSIRSRPGSAAAGGQRFFEAFVLANCRA